MRTLVLLLALSLLCACGATAQGPGPTPAAQGLQPEEIRIYNAGGDEQRLTDADAAYVPVNTALNTVLASLDGQLRTLYDDARYQAEIATRPRLEADYGGEVRLPVATLEVTAARVTVVRVEAQVLVLARTDADPTWGVYTSSATAFEALRDVVASELAVDLE